MAAQKSSKWWVLYAVVVVLGGPYVTFFTKWGAGAYEAVCLLLFVYGLGAIMYSLVRPLFHRLRLNRVGAAAERPVSEIEMGPAAKTSFFHDDPSRVGKSGIGMPTLVNYGVKKTVAFIVFFLSAGCLVHYLSAVPRRAETLIGLGFLSAIAFYLWLLVRFAKSVYRWLKRHTHRTAMSGMQGR